MNIGIIFSVWQFFSAGNFTGGIQCQFRAYLVLDKAGLVTAEKNLILNRC